MKKLVASLISCLISILQVMSYANSYETWPDEIPVPSIDIEEYMYSRFDKRVKIHPQNGTVSNLKQYQVGIIVTDLTGKQSPRDFQADFSESSNYFNVVIGDLFPETKYELNPYITIDGIKHLSNKGLVFNTDGLMRDQNSQWGDYSHTQTTITIKGLTGNKRLQILEDGKYVDISQEGYKIENLNPRPWYGNSFGEKEGIERQFCLYIGEQSKIYTETLYTAYLRLKLNCEVSSTGLLLKPECPSGDADIQGFKLQSDLEEIVLSDINDASIWYGELEPNTKYSFQLSAIVKSKETGLDYTYPMRKYSAGSYLQKVTFTTSTIKFGDVNVSGVSSSATIAKVETNINDRETNVGFMWKKYDAPASLKPSEGYAAMSNGCIEGKIKNLQAQFYYNVRPFYKSKAGKYYYGEWTTFDPSDFSYIEPTLKTYAPLNVSPTSIILRGYALEGSDEILEQGFEYWNENSSNLLTSYNAARSNERTRIISSGQNMSVELDNLLSGTSYIYRTYAVTSKGDFFSEPQTFKTEESSGITNTYNDVDSPYILGYYTIQGQKLHRPQKGINIIVFSNGSAKKIIVK